MVPDDQASLQGTLQKYHLGCKLQWGRWHHTHQGALWGSLMRPAVPHCGFALSRGFSIPSSAQVHPPGAGVGQLDLC